MRDCAAGVTTMCRSGKVLAFMELTWHYVELAGEPDIKLL